MKECASCGQMHDLEEFESSRNHEKHRGVLTKNCKGCRARTNEARRQWYATNEKERIANPTR